MTTARIVRVPAAPVTLRLVEAPAAPASREPEWFGRSWQATRREVVKYYRTAIAFGLHPRRTAEAWADGRFDALNPIAYLLNSIAILGPWRALWQWLLHVPDVPLWVDVLYTVSPFLALLSGAVTNHFAFRLFGSKRRFQSTIAISIYATGGLPIVLNLITTPFTILTVGLRTPHEVLAHWPHYAVSYTAVGLALLWVSPAYAGLHGTTRRRALGILLLAAVALMAVALVVWAEMVMFFIFYMTRIHH